MMLLTAKSVSALTMPEGKTDHIEWDAELKGFGYRLRAEGGKVRRTWVAQYRRTGATRRIKLGDAAVLSAEKARTAAKKVLAAVTLGKDPQADRAERRSKDQLSMRAVVDEYLAAKAATLRPRSLFEFKRYLAGPRYLKPLHSTPIDKIGRKDIAARLVAITRESGSITAAHIRTVMNAFFSWCMQMGYVESNPTIGTIKPQDSEPRERVLTDTELAAVWCASGGDDDHSRIIRLLILTGCRRQEIGGMRWSELDAERGLWVLPGERSKNKKPHTLPLPPLAWDIINSVPRMANRDYLFGVRAEGFRAWAQYKRALDQALGDAVGSWTVHDLRRTTATKMADLGIAPHVIEQILNHQSGHKSGIAGVYNKSSYEREVRAALLLWSDCVRALAEGGERKVVALPTAS